MISRYQSGLRSFNTQSPPCPSPERQSHHHLSLSSALQSGSASVPCHTFCIDLPVRPFTSACRTQMTACGKLQAVFCGSEINESSHACHMNPSDPCHSTHTTSSIPTVTGLQIPPPGQRTQVNTGQLTQLHCAEFNLWCSCADYSIRSGSSQHRTSDRKGYIYIYVYIKVTFDPMTSVQSEVSASCCNEERTAASWVLFVQQSANAKALADHS